jgi:hypothetical protein
LSSRCAKALEQTLPKSLDYKLVSRTSGTASLGQSRFVAIAEWKGGLIARDAKATVPSASALAQEDHAAKNYYNEILESAVRAHDPFSESRRRVADSPPFFRFKSDCYFRLFWKWPLPSALET